MQSHVGISLVAWVPASVMLFVLLGPRRGALVSLIGGWLFLPVVQYSFPGFPDLSKTTAAAAGVLLGILLTDPFGLWRLRPRLADLPVVVWCAAPLFSSLSNDLGVYDGLAGALDHVITWGVPYLVGRIYFRTPPTLRELALGIFVAGLVYAPLCLWEVRMSPQLHRMLYGFPQAPFAETIRMGGFRPMVFTAHGLALGMFMTSASLIGFWLWYSRTSRQIAGVSTGAALAALLVTTVLCKSFGALVLLLVALVALPAAYRFGRRTVVTLLVLSAPCYMFARATDLWSGEGAVELAAMFSTERSLSLKTRLRNDALLAEKALERPIFGWGGWARARVVHYSRDVAITDGLWIIALGNHGVVGLASVTALMLLPVLLLRRRYHVRHWRSRQLAPVAVLAITLVLYACDSVMNAMPTPLVPLMAGAVTGFATRRPLRARVKRPLEGRGAAAPGSRRLAAGEISATS